MRLMSPYLLPFSPAAGLKLAELGDVLTHPEKVSFGR
jgi:hypothetical protein